MREEDAFLKAIQANPADDLSRLVYADWLEERGDARSEFLRVHVALRSLPPDHPHRARGEQELSRLRTGIDTDWLTVAEPERAHLSYAVPIERSCECFNAGYENRSWSDVKFHIEPQDTECDAWKRLLDLIEEAAADGWTEFSLRRGADLENWRHIVTLLPTLAPGNRLRRQRQRHRRHQRQRR
jgi:uncharacterized protein (TIGR02996 family)